MTSDRLPGLRTMGGEMTDTLSVLRRSDTAKRASARIQRLDKRRREELPLFATDQAVLDSVAPLPSVDETTRFLYRQQASACAMVLRVRKLCLDQWFAQRRIAEQYLTLDQVRYMEAHYPATWPRDYRSDWWRMVLRDLGVRQ